MIARFSSVLGAALALSLSAGFVAPTHAAPVSGGVKQHRLAQAGRPQIQLSDEQRKQIQTIMKEMQDDIIKNVLTDTQRKNMQTNIANGQSPAQVISALSLTDAQKTQIREKRQAANKRIFDNVLTAEQKQQVQNMRSQQPAK